MRSEDELEQKSIPSARAWISRVALFVGLAVATGCGSYVPPTTDFHVPAPSGHDWATILAQPGKVSIERLETGRVRVNRSDLLDFDDPRASGLKDEELLVPVYAYLLRYPDRGDYVIDAGLDHSFQHVTSGDMKGTFAFKFYGRQRVGEDLPSQLQARGVKLRGVFFTHLHPDHVSGATSLPHDVPYIVGKGERPKSFGSLFYEDALMGVADLEEIDFSKAATMPPLGPAVDVFGDGSLWAISTPGHTVAHMSFVVVSKTGPVLITGDVSHTHWGFDHGVIPGKFNDGTKADSRRSMAELRAFAAAFPNVKVYVGHEK